MVKKVLSVLCVATIIGSATAGVLLCLRRRKGKGQGKTAEEAEGNRAAAGGRVDAENIRIGDVVEAGPVEVAVENAVDGDKDGSKESTGVAFQEPDANYAFSAGAIPVLGVTSGSRTFDERTRWGSAAAAASNARVAFVGTSARSVPIGRGFLLKSGNDVTPQASCKSPTTAPPATTSSDAAVNSALGASCGTHFFQAPMRSELPVDARNETKVRPSKTSKMLAAALAANPAAKPIPTPIQTPAVKPAAMPSAAKASTLVAAVSSTAGNRRVLENTTPASRPMFEERKQNWPLSSRATAILQACKVSNKELFLAKCEDCFGRPQGSDT